MHHLITILRVYTEDVDKKPGAISLPPPRTAENRILFTSIICASWRSIDIFHDFSLGYPLNLGFAIPPSPLPPPRASPTANARNFLKSPRPCIGEHSFIFLKYVENIRKYYVENMEEVCRKNGEVQDDPELFPLYSR